MTPPESLDTLSKPRTVPVKPEARPFLMETVNVLGMRFHAVDMDQALQAIDCWILEKVPRHICLANAYTLALGRWNADLQRLINGADLTLPDGMSIVWGARWLGLEIPCRVAGPDLTEALCERAAQKGYSVFLMGSSTENLGRLKEVLLLRWPDLRVAGTHSPPIADRFNEHETQVILREIHAAQPDVLLVGVSAPKQEIWIAENLTRLHVPVSIGVGAAFDFLSGRIPRAPDWLQRTGFEWLYRLYREPRRLWKRYLIGNFIFLLHLTQERLRRRFSRRPGTSPPFE